MIAMIIIIIIPFVCNTIQVLFLVTRDNLKFTLLSDPILNLWGTTGYSLFNVKFLVPTRFL